VRRPLSPSIVRDKGGRGRDGAGNTDAICVLQGDVVKGALGSSWAGGVGASASARSASIASTNASITSDRDRAGSRKCDEHKHLQATQQT
jgi:hypothetical protein